MNLAQRCVPVLALLVVAVTTGAGVPNRSLTLSPASAAPGTPVAVAGALGADCVDAQSVSVRLDGAVIASTLTFTVPAQAAAGRHSISVTCDFSDGVDSATLREQAAFTVLAVPADTDPGDSDPGNPGPADPRPADPRPADPRPADPRPVDPRPADPGPIYPGPVDPGPVDPGPVDPGPVDPGPVDPGPVDPGPVDPRPVDPAPPDSYVTTTAWLVGLIAALVGLVALIRSAVRRRPGRSRQRPARSSTPHSTDESAGVDVRVVVRHDPGELTLRDRVGDR
jgi:hypothetical protein